MSEESKVRIRDKRGQSAGGSGSSDPPLRSAPEATADAGASSGAESAQRVPSSSGHSGEGAEEKHDYLADLQRLQAEFDNYRKRTIKEQTAVVERASGRVVERLLPVLDNFEKAVEHGEGGGGIELSLAELHKVLADEGLEEIEAEGRPFDPRVHEAFSVVEDPEVEEPVVRAVYRRGFRLKGRVLRPAMVQVARPPEPQEDEASDPETGEIEGATGGAT